MNWTPQQAKEYMQKRLKDEQRTRTKLYETANTSVGAVVPRRPQRNPVFALDSRGKACRQSKGRVAVRVTLITCRRRELDDDSSIYSLKPLRDAIAATLGIDDADARIKWHYGQTITGGETGVIVKIETL